jgi:DNA processing protein
MCYYEKVKHLNALNKIEGVGSQKLRRLLDWFGSAEKAWSAGIKELEASGLSAKLSAKIVSQRSSIDPEREWAEMEKQDIRMITASDETYPRLLREIPNPPQILYVRGHLEALNSQPMISIVGSRKFTQYGAQVAGVFAKDLAHAGITVVSGLALGIDAIAHRATLDAGGTAVAVIGSSLEDKNIGPRTNFDLAQNILLSGGAIVSEYPLGVTALPANFPARNRIMAGMTLGTLVVEAALESGTLITAGLALEFNREVFAVPGPIFSPSSEGTHQLIKNGAKMACGVQDILEELRLEQKNEIEKAKKILPASPEEEKILKILTHEPTHIDNIIKMAKLEASASSSTLVILEMKGLVKDIGGQNYIAI